LRAEDTKEDWIKLVFERDIECYPDGIVLPVDKPYRWTSADVVRKLKYAAKRHFGKKNLKVGHAGTLDPLATGLLLVCIGAATKRAEELQSSPKQYIAGVSFGAVTASCDLEKEVTGFLSTDRVSRDAVEVALHRFLGEQNQVAPLFSAKSVDGVRAYEMARKLYREGKLEEDGNELIKASKINIYSLELLSFDDAFSLPEAAPAGSVASSRINVSSAPGRTFPTAVIKIDCSKGTYIRSFARDLGETLGSGAFLSSLRRTKNGGFNIEDAVSVEDALAMFGKED